MASVMIEVTQGDIEAGRRGDPARCPIALAVRRVFPEAYRVTIRGIVALYRQPKSASYLRMAPPDEAIRFVQDFDAGQPVSPFSFAIEVPEGLSGTEESTA